MTEMDRMPGPAKEFPEQIVVQVGRGVRKAIRDEAERDGLSGAAVVRKALDAYFARQPAAA